MESKHGLYDDEGVKHPLLIEPVWNRNGASPYQWQFGISFNRTSMESKPGKWKIRRQDNPAFNRTSMESKLDTYRHLSRPGQHF